MIILSLRSTFLFLLLFLLTTPAACQTTMFLSELFLFFTEACGLGYVFTLIFVLWIIFTLCQLKQNIHEKENHKLAIMLQEIKIERLKPIISYWCLIDVWNMITGGRTNKWLDSVNWLILLPLLFSLCALGTCASMRCYKI